MISPSKKFKVLIMICNNFHVLSYHILSLISILTKIIVIKSDSSIKVLGKLFEVLRLFGVGSNKEEMTECL